MIAAASATGGIAMGGERAGGSLVYEVKNDGRLVARLFAMRTAGGNVRVAAEVHPVSAPADAEPQWQFHELSPRDAARFLEESLDAFEYLGCAIRQVDSGEGEQAVHASAA